MITKSAIWLCLNTTDIVISEPSGCSADCACVIGSSKRDLWSNGQNTGVQFASGCMLLLCYRKWRNYRYSAVSQTLCHLLLLAWTYLVRFTSLWVVPVQNGTGVFTHASTRAPYISRKWMTSQRMPSLMALCVLLHAEVNLVTCVPTTGRTSSALTTNLRGVLSNWVEQDHPGCPKTWYWMGL